MAAGFAEESVGAGFSNGEALSPPVEEAGGGNESASVGGGSGAMSFGLARIAGAAGGRSSGPAGTESELGPRATDFAGPFARRSAISAAD